MKPPLQTNKPQEYFYQKLLKSVKICHKVIDRNLLPRFYGSQCIILATAFRNMNLIYLQCIQEIDERVHIYCIQCIDRLCQFTSTFGPIF